MQRWVVIKLGVASGALMALAGGGLALMRPGLRAGRLTPAGREVFAAVARAVPEGTLPLEPAAQAAALHGQMARLDATILASPPAMQDELGQLITLLASSAGGLLITGLVLLMRSKVADPHRLLGTRTFLHPVVLSAATFEQRIEGGSGAPQTLYTDHFLDVAPIDGPIGYKLEAPPMHPIIFSLTVTGFGT